MSDTPNGRFMIEMENVTKVYGRKTAVQDVSLQVRQGEAVELSWSADRRSVVHLHGYDIEATIDAGKPQTMAFRAHATGRFPIEMHDARHTVLLYLEVHPR